MSDKKRTNTKGFLAARSSNERLKKQSEDLRKHNRAALTKRLRYSNDPDIASMQDTVLTDEALSDLVDKLKVVFAFNINFP